MLVFMLPAFGRAGIARFGAYAADIVSVSRGSAHKSRGGPAERSAVAVESNALGHHGDIIFLQA